MATVHQTLVVEIDLLYDAIADIECIMRALVKCHGGAYRALERRIEAMAEGRASMGEPRMHSIGGGRFVFEPFPELKAIIAEARELGVI